jgi:predicted SAM-dependent methyltransferase
MRNFAPPSTADALPDGAKINLGCGPVQPRGWINVDGSNRAWLANRLWVVDRLMVGLGLLPKTEFGRHVTVHDLKKPLPFADGAAACIYAGELWEHFEYPDAARLTQECFRVLAPGGVLRICVPDGAAFWETYLELYREQLGRPPGQRNAKPLRDHVGMYFRDIATRRIVLGSIGHTHKWQFDEVQLVELLASAGFVDVARASFHRSRIDDVAAVENSDFLIVEAVKPRAEVAARAAA